MNESLTVRPEQSTELYSTMYNEPVSSTTVQPSTLPPLQPLQPLQPLSNNERRRSTDTRHLESRVYADRFLPRANKTIVKSGGLAEACGVRVNRVLEFNPYSQKSLNSASDLVGKYQQQPFQSSFGGMQPARSAAKKMRKIYAKPVKILDAPGLADDFYSNLLDWSSSLDVMAIGLDRCVYSWNAKTKDVQQIADGASLPPGVRVSSVKWAEDGCIAVAHTNGEIQLWDAEQQTQLRTMRGRRGRVAALSWNDYTLSSGGHDGSVWNHDVRVKHHKAAELRAHSAEVCGLTWRADGRFLASGGNDNIVNVWDNRIFSAPRLQLTKHEAAVKALAWCPWQSGLLATGGGSADQTVRMWNTNSGACVETLNTGAQVTALNWNSDFREIVASLGYPTNSIAIWAQEPNMKYSKQIEIMEAHASRILHATLSADGSTLVTGAADETLKFWSLFEGQKERTPTYTRSLLTMGRV